MPPHTLTGPVAKGFAWLHTVAKGWAWLHTLGTWHNLTYLNLGFSAPLAAGNLNYRKFGDVGEADPFSVLDERGIVAISLWVRAEHCPH
jgi:hypothetical protein